MVENNAGNIVLDHIIFALQNHGGISVWWKHLVDGLMNSSRYRLIHCGDYRNSNALANEIPCRFRGRLPFCWPLISVPLVDRSVIDGVFHSSYFRIPEHSGLKQVVTYHDGALSHGQSIRSMLHRAMQSRCLRRASIIHCISKHSASECVRCFPEANSKPIVVVPHGFSRPTAVGDCCDDLLPWDMFVSFVGQRQFRKNGMLALQSITRMPNNVGLVLIGGGPLSAIEKQTMQELNLTDRVVCVPSATEEQKYSILSKSLCLWYLSSNEGFGFPVLEAASVGCPVLALPGHAVEELFGDYVMFTANQAPVVGEIVSITMSIMTSNRSSFIARGNRLCHSYTWAKTVEAMTRIYDDCLACPGVP